MPNVTRYILFGHSKGGANVRLLAARMLKSGVYAEDIILRTFGCPRCGDNALKALLCEIEDQTNYWNDGDPVPSVPRIILPLFPYTEMPRTLINSQMQPGDVWPGKPSWVRPHWGKLYERGAMPGDQWMMQNINDFYKIDAEASVKITMETAKYWGWDGYQNFANAMRIAWKRKDDRTVLICSPGTEDLMDGLLDVDAAMIAPPVLGGVRVHAGFWQGIEEAWQTISTEPTKETKK